MKRTLLALALLLSVISSPARAVTITSGDTTPITLTFKSGGALFDLTGAVFSTQLLCSDGSVRTIPDGQHVNLGSSQATIALTSSDYTAIGTGRNKEILVQVTQGPSVTYFHGTGLLTILPNLPVK